MRAASFFKKLLFCIVIMEHQTKQKKLIKD